MGVGSGPWTCRPARAPPPPGRPSRGWRGPRRSCGGVHERFGDPVTIRTYWTDEPMVLFSHPDAVREVFRLDPAIAPAGQSWEFLRPFAGPHSILLLDGEEHLRERRLMQAPFHGERMRAFAPIVADLARARAEHLERPRDDAGADAPPDAGDHPARRVRRPRRAGGRAAARRRRTARSTAFARCRGCSPWRSSSATSGRAARGAASASRSSASTRCCSTSWRAGAPSRAATRCSRCCSSSATRTATRRRTGTCATSSSRCSSAATTARRRRSRGPSSGSRAIRRCTPACATATPPTSTRSSRRCCGSARR